MEPVLIILLVAGGAAAIGKKIVDRYQQHKQVADMANVFETDLQRDDITLPLSESIPRTP